MTGERTVMYAALAAIAAAMTYILWQSGRYASERMSSPYKYFTYREFDTGATRADIDNGVDTWFSPLHGNRRVVGSGEAHMNKAFMRKLDLIREDAGFPFIITSGYRSPGWNAQVGGSANSAHMDGLAADIRVLTDAQRTALVKAALKHGVTRFGWGRNYLHIDMDTSKPQHVVWGYNGGPTPPKFADLNQMA
jgi:hypothetical protein